MQTFKARVIDIDLELTTLGGEELTLKPKIVLNTTNVVKIIKDWTNLEVKDNELIKKEEKSPFDLIATELAMIYPKSKEWFLDNFDIFVLGEILKFVAGKIGDVKKSPVTLNTSSSSEDTELELPNP